MDKIDSIKRLSIAFGIAVGLAACSPPSDTTQSEKNLRIAFFADNTTLVSIDPFQVYWLEHRVLLRNVAESLTDQDPASGEIIPWLAKSWEVSEDSLTYTFKLRNDVTFSNGERFDANAVKIAFDSNKAFAKQVPATFGATYLAGYDHAEVIDDFTIKLVLSSPNAGFLQATSTTNLSILSPSSYTLSPEQRSLGKIVGTGPFTLEHYTPESGARLVKRPGYAWASANALNRGDSHVDSVDISYIPEESVRNGLFLQGELDILWPRLPFSEIDQQLLRSRGAEIQSRSLPGPAINLYPNTRDNRPLANKQLRLALQKSIDRQSYAKTVYSPDFPVVSGIYDITTPFYKSQVEHLAYDPSGAESLLEDAGWTKNSNGYRYKDGKRLSLELNINGSETPGDVLIQDQLRKVGIDLKLNVVTRAEWAENNASGRYDLTSVYMTRADPIILQTILDPRAAYSSTVATNTYEPQILLKAQKLFDAGLTASRPDQRALAYGELQDLLIKEGSAFPVAERLIQAATSAQVRNFHWTAEGIALFNDIELVEP